MYGQVLVRVSIKASVDHIRSFVALSLLMRFCPIDTKKVTKKCSPTRGAAMVASEQLTIHTTIMPVDTSRLPADTRRAIMPVEASPPLPDHLLAKNGGGRTSKGDYQLPDKKRPYDAAAHTWVAIDHLNLPPFLQYNNGPPVTLWSTPTPAKAPPPAAKAAPSSSPARQKNPHAKALAATAAPSSPPARQKNPYAKAPSATKAPPRSLAETPARAEMPPPEMPQSEASLDDRYVSRLNDLPARVSKYKPIEGQSFTLRDMTREQFREVVRDGGYTTAESACVHVTQVAEVFAEAASESMRRQAVHEWAHVDPNTWLKLDPIVDGDKKMAAEDVTTSAVAATYVAKYATKDVAPETLEDATKAAASRAEDEERPAARAGAPDDVIAAVLKDYDEDSEPDDPDLFPPSDDDDEDSGPDDELFPANKKTTENDKKSEAANEKMPAVTMTQEKKKIKDEKKTAAAVTKEKKKKEDE